jgi:hypothetical protein
MKNIFIAALVIGLVIYTGSYRSMAQNSPTARTHIPVNDTAKERKKSSFWETFMSELSTNIKNKDSLKKVKFEKTTYVTGYLKTNHIIPNEESVALIKLLNPHLSSADSIKYGTPLFIPEMEKAPRYERRELNREFRKFNTYNRSDHVRLKQQIDQLNLRVSNVKDIKLVADPTYLVKEFYVSLNTIHNYYNANQSTKFSVGKMQLLEQQVITINKVLDAVISSRTVSSLQTTLFKQYADQTRPTGKRTPGTTWQYDPAGNSRGSGIASLAIQPGDEYHFNDATEFFFDDEEDDNKKIYIYAVVPRDGRLEQLTDQYSFAMMTPIDAWWDCKNNNCGGFINHNDPVSVAGATIAVTKWVFRYTNLATKKVYWRCYSREQFIIEGNKAYLLFCPEIEGCSSQEIPDCKIFLW